MTKLSPLILAFIVALGFVSAVAWALPSVVTQRVQMLSRDDYWMRGFAKVSAPNHRVMGDPINDPKPNNR